MTKIRRVSLGDGLQAAPEMVRTVPQRIQRKRTKGWRAPEGALYVGRPTRYGNPFSVAEHGRAGAVARFEAHLTEHPEIVAQIRDELGGKDLACWCRLDQACHADALLHVANDGGAE